MKNANQDDPQAMATVAGIHLLQASEAIEAGEYGRASLNARIAARWLLIAADGDGAVFHCEDVAEAIAPIVLGQGDYRRSIRPRIKPNGH